MSGTELPDWLREDYPPPASSATAQESAGMEDASNPTTSDVNNTAVNDNTSPPDSNEEQRQYVGFKDALFREWKILLLAIGMLVLMNAPLVRYAFYPFDIFATWIHEICHGTAALLLGGKILKLEIFPDTSGLATTQIPDGDRRGFVSSAGYQGTAVFGFLLLIFRRTKRGPRFGLIVLALWMIVSVAVWVRNLFGIVSILSLGVLFLLAGWKLPSAWMRAFYTVVCITVSLNAMTDVVALFGANSYINGEPQASDAKTMAELTALTSWMWASIWFLLAVVLTLLGVVLAIPGPGEDPAFRCCGACLDCGLFSICNATTKKKNDGDDEAIEKIPEVKGSELL